jgi:hypothetical protein
MQLLHVGYYIGTSIVTQGTHMLIGSSCGFYSWLRRAKPECDGDRETTAAIVSMRKIGADLTH